MLYFILTAVYFLAAFGTAYLGRNTLAGAGGTFILALLLTPLVVFPALMLFTRRRKAR